MKILGYEISKQKKANKGSFIPLTSQGDVLDVMFGIGSQYAKYTTNKQVKEAFDKCPIIPTIITAKNRCFVNGKIEVLNTKDNFLPDSNGWVKLIKKPNPFQTEIQFKSQLYFTLQLYGYAFGIKGRPYGVNDVVSSMMILPNELLEIEFNNKLMFGSSPKNNIKSVHLVYEGVRTPINIKELYLFTNLGSTNLFGEYLPTSPLVGLEYPINNIIKSYESAGTIIERRGAFGILSNSANDGIGVTPFDEAQKTQLQQDYRKYGLSKDQFQIIITNLSLNWQQMSLSIKDLMINEEIETRSIEIADRYGYPKYLLGIGDSGTFANVNEAQKFLYHSVIIPEAEHFIEQFNEFLFGESSSIHLAVNFKDVEVLQEDKERRAKARYLMNKALEIEYKAKLITLNQWLVALEYDTIEGGDVYYSEPIKEVPNETTN